MKDSTMEYLPDQEGTKHGTPKSVASVALRPGEYDPLAETTEPAKPTTRASAPVLRVLSLSEILNYEPPVGSMLVGDGIIELGEIAMLYGSPGSYKGFAVGQLMAYGAQGYGNWLGHPVKAQFASLWLNCENSQRRLRDQFRKMALPPEAERFIHVTDIPAVWDLSDRRLIEEIRRLITEKLIRLLIIDTVSNFTGDEFAKEYAAFFAALNTMLHGLERKPAVLLIHHARKPKDTDRGGRSRLNTISGHQLLQRRARSICNVDRVSDALDEKRIVAVWLKVSNSGDAEGTKAALRLAEDATLQEIKDFDWNEWHATSGGSAKREPKVGESHIRESFQEGARRMTLKHAVECLQEIAHVGRSAAYEALRLDGRFGHLLVKDADDLIGLKNGV